MQITVYPGKLSGSVRAVSSKSQAHRMLILASVSDKPCRIICPDTNEDIDATVSCLRALGARIERKNGSFHVEPVRHLPTEVMLDCRESGSTLRFLLPFVGALGVKSTFLLRGRLSQRPLSPLWEEMERMGCNLSRPTANTILCIGRLRAGNYTINGSVSSQFITGLLFALAVLPGNSKLEITGNLQSKPYVDITKDVLSAFHVNMEGNYIVGKFPLTGPEQLTVEGDWSSAAFFFVSNAIGSNICVENLNPNSFQGDRAIEAVISHTSTMQTIDVSQCPDLMPILSVLAAAKSGAEFVNIQRLRLKESDRVQSVQEMLSSMGIRTESTEDRLKVWPGEMKSCTVNSYNDHRIAMAAAIAATVASGPISIIDGQCVSKSYPAFWKDFSKLGGNYEQLER